MAPFLRKLRVTLSTQFALMTEYRAEVIIWTLSGTLSLAMLLVCMAQAGSAPGGRIRGYTPGDFAAYFLSTWVVGQLMVVWVAWELDTEVRQGTLSPRLVRFLALTALFAWLAGARVTGDLWAYPAALGLALLGFSARFLWEYCVGLLAFWTESSTSSQEVVWPVYAALGGMFAPLSFYLEWVQRVAVWTPFPDMLGLPARLLTGKGGLADAGQGALVLTAWLLAFWLLRLSVWRVGPRKYGAVGA
ncbi:ABC transporter permease [Deinococcus hopiensis]|uniref:ABC-2 type transport system permease protein n=1 Tax=Deinococcus hopiensis KR-140 TaxID=695939 RepID=A0A1W1VG13_9DEIO|nr:ABC-2 family transporter protein [Deinococcus hopiensis]SMB91904.1 ABC-2 type transport system permease protein [Deinococcus hopiensis KR-140]